MRFITTNDIESWTDTVDCKYYLSHLIRRLILATLDHKKIKNIHFPLDKEVYTNGFDGELNTEEGNVFVPEGRSVWEFCMGSGKNAEADSDGEQGKKIPSGVTYINVNAKKYGNKDKWLQAKKEEGHWKEVYYFDAVDIGLWLELAPDVELWFAELLKKPALGVYSAQEYWRKWSESDSIIIDFRILLGETRTLETEVVKSFLVNDEKVLYIKSMTLDEALAFSLAVFRKVNLLGTNIIVVDNRELFIYFIESRTSLIILVKFRIQTVDIKAANEKGHKIIVPITPGEEVGNLLQIQLPIVSRNTFETALQRMGMDYEQIRFLTKNSGRNITVLKRLLKFGHTVKPQYLEHADLMMDFVPMLLINKFSEDSPGDMEVIEKLSGKKADQYIQYLRILAGLRESPVYSVNGIWMLVSAADVWMCFAKYISAQCIVNFQEVSLEILGEVMPRYILSVEARKELFLAEKTKYSSQLREGVCESLAMISDFGDRYNVDFKVDVSAVTKDIVDKTLGKDAVVWKSLSDYLSLLAEVSPAIFLNHVERMIREKTITAFFENRQSFSGNSNDLEALLGSLNIVAWFPEHLMRASIIFCEIILLHASGVSPNSRSSFDHLKNIYRICHPQTNASKEERQQVLNILMTKYPDILFSMLLELIDHDYDITYESHKPVWKLFSELRTVKADRAEMKYMHCYCVDTVIALSEGNAERILLLIQILDRIEKNKINKALNIIESALLLEVTDQVRVYHQFRKFIGKHRSNIEALWALPVNILDRIQKTVEKFIPKDYIDHYSYLFQEYYPEFTEGYKKDDCVKYEEEIVLKRLEFIKEVINSYGVNKIFELSLKTDHPYLYGTTLALCDCLDDENQMKVYGLVESIHHQHLSLVSSFIGISENNTSLKAQTTVLEHLIKSGLSKRGIVNFICAMHGGIDLWRYISKMDEKDIEKTYWQSQQRFLYTSDKAELFYVLDKLHCYKMTAIFFNTLGKGTKLHKEVLSTEELVDALGMVSFTGPDDLADINLNLFNDIWELIYAREDYDKARLAKMEMKFITVFTRAGTHLKPKALFSVMSKDPNQYFEILSRVCLPEKELKDEALQDIKREIKHQSQDRAVLKALWQILNAFNFIPSLQKDGSLDRNVLKEWIGEVRKLGKEHHRIKVTDHYIGKLLARYPVSILENKGFAVEIYEVLEEVNTEEAKIAFHTQLLNYLGYTSKGELDGGEIERTRANYFAMLFESTKLTYPHVAQVFKNLEEMYRLDARKESRHGLLRSLE